MPKSKNKKQYYVDKYIDGKIEMSHGPFSHKDATDLQGALRLTTKQDAKYEVREENL